MSYVAMPLHDCKRIVRQRPGKYVDVRKHGADGAAKNGNSRSRRAQCAGYASFADFGGDVAAGK